MKKALLNMHVAVLLWGFTGVLGRAITLNAFALVWWRMLLTCLIVTVILYRRHITVWVSKKAFLQLTAIGALMALHWVAFYASIKLANASIALVCLSTASIAVSFLEPLLNKTKFNPLEILIGILALAGVYCIYRFQQFYAWGIFFGILAAILSGLFTILNKRIAADHEPRLMIFYEMGTGLLFLTLLLPAWCHFQPDSNFLPLQVNPKYWLQDFPKTFSLPNDWLWLGTLSLACTVWAQTLALKALQVISSFTATLSVNLEPLYGIFLAILFFNENTELNAGFYVGMSLILLSVLIQTLSVVSKITNKGSVTE